MISLLYVNIVCGKDTNRFFKLENPDRFRFIAVCDTCVVRPTGMSFTDDDPGKTNHIRLILKALSRDQTWRRERN